MLTLLRNSFQLMAQYKGNFFSDQMPVLDFILSAVTDYGCTANKSLW